VHSTPFYLSKSEWLYFSLWSPSLRSSSTNPARLTTSYVGMSKFLLRRAGGEGGEWSVQLFSYQPLGELRLTEIIVFIPCERAEMGGTTDKIHYSYI